MDEFLLFVKVSEAPLTNYIEPGRDIFCELKQKPYVSIPFPLSRHTMNEAAESFFRFLSLPENVKTHIDLDIAPQHRRGEIGYRHRNPNDDIYNDSKDFFHYHPLILKEYPQFLFENPTVKDFMDRAQPIWQAAYDLINEIMINFEAHCPGTRAKIFSADAHEHVVIRFLRYDWAECGQYLAKPHFDAGSFTLALSESCAGLRIGTGPDDLELIEHQENRAVFMVASNYRKIIDTDELTPGWHDVVQLDETKIGKPYSRWAIVAFIDGHNVEALSREETHKYYIAS